jgi:hypothetical protein
MIDKDKKQMDVARKNLNKNWSLDIAIKRLKDSWKLFKKNTKCTI